MFTVSVLGYGGRGSVYARNFSVQGVEIAAVCDPDPKRLELAAGYTGNLYSNEDDFFSAGKLSDLLVISTMDRLHFEQTMKALELGYDVLLEKPIATNAEHCRRIAQKAKEKNRNVIVCHVLRYSPFFRKIKELLSEGSFGKVINLQLTEDIGYYHFAHSYVRGNWRNRETSAPVILAKSCHDLDIINWLVDDQCTRLSSYGSLQLFRKECAPENSTAHCKDCPVRDKCVFDCFKIYTNQEYERLAGLARHGHLGTTEEEIRSALSNEAEPYGRCVYRCDNNVFDNQIVNMEFAHGAHAQFMLSAFTEGMSRCIKIGCEKGVIYGSLEKNTLHSIRYGQREERCLLSHENELYASHGGGDMGIVLGVMEFYQNGSACASSVEQSVSSHLMCFAAEESANRGGEVISL